MSPEEEERLRREARKMEHRQMMKHNVAGFLNIMQNPENSENQRSAAKSYLGDLVERLRRSQYQDQFKHLLAEVEIDFDKTSKRICQNYKGASKTTQNYETCKVSMQLLLVLFLTQNIHGHLPTYDNIRQMTFNFLQDKINGINPAEED